MIFYLYDDACALAAVIRFLASLLRPNC